METSTRLSVLEIFVSKLVCCSTCLFILIRRHGKVVVIYKVVASVIRRVYINHFHLAHIRALEKFQHFEVVALDIQVLRRVPIFRILNHRPKSLVGRSSCLCLCGILAHPAKLVSLAAVIYCIVAQKLAQCVKINGTFYPPLASRLSVKTDGAI